MQENQSKFLLRKAEFRDKEIVWKILQEGIERRKKDGSIQWQNGYPNPESIENDIRKNQGFVLETDGEIAAYTAIIFDIEPAYEIIEGKWLSDEKYVVIHRVAVSDKFAGKGIAAMIFREIERIAVAKNVFSIKVDTIFDNIPMLKVFEKMGYTYCGEVYFSGSPRKAFNKLLK